MNTAGDEPGPEAGAAAEPSSEPPVVRRKPTTSVALCALGSGFFLLAVYLFFFGDSQYYNLEREIGSARLGAVGLPFVAIALVLQSGWASTRQLRRIAAAGAAAAASSLLLVLATSGIGSDWRSRTEWGWVIAAGYAVAWYAVCETMRQASLEIGDAPAGPYVVPPKSSGRWIAWLLRRLSNVGTAALVIAALTGPLRWLLALELLGPMRYLTREAIGMGIWRAGMRVACVPNVLLVFILAVLWTRANGPLAIGGDASAFANPIAEGETSTPR